MISTLLQPHTCKNDSSLDKPTIANLRTEQIAEMDEEMLIDLIRVSELPQVQGTLLEYKDRPLLEQLAHLARFSCINQGF